MALTMEREVQAAIAADDELENELNFCRKHYGFAYEETDLMLNCMPYNGMPVLFFREGFEQPSLERSRAIAILLICYRSFCNQIYKPNKRFEVSVKNGQIVYCELHLDSTALEFLEAMGVEAPEYNPPEWETASTNEPLCTALATVA